MNFDLNFWITTLQENGFKIEPTLYYMPKDVLKDIKRTKLIAESIEVLYDDFPAQIIYVQALSLDRKNEYRITRRQAGFLVKLVHEFNITSALPVFIISDARDSYIFIHPIDKETGLPVKHDEIGEPLKYAVEYFSGELTPKQRKILENLKPYKDVEAYNNLLSAR